MTSAVLLDHVSAYAAAVRAHLADLSPEQVEDLTDGLEADLAEALEDREGPVVTGEIPIGRAAADAGIPAPPGAAPGASMIDLTRRFGPADAYATELRAAAGVEPPGQRPGGAAARAGLGLVARLGGGRRRVVGLVRAVRDVAAVAATAPTTPWGRWLVSTAGALRPLWWLVRGWVWFVLAVSLVWPGVSRLHPLGFYVPMDVGAWLLLAVFVAVSVSGGHGLGGQRRWVRGGFAVVNVIAILALPTSLANFDNELRYELSSPRIEYIEVPVEVEVPVTTPVEDGVYVDGMLVSNLFVYDAEGNPLESVQIYDDRGRSVRTIQRGWADWQLPGVSETWRFVAAVDGDGRDRWNVYPLMGAPRSSWDTEAESTLLEGEDLRMPPLPFAKAPAVALRTGQDPEAATDG